MSPYTRQSTTILSLSSRKDEPNAGFPVSIMLPVWVLEAISSSCLGRANGTFQAQFLSIQILTQPHSHCLPESNFVGSVQIGSAFRLQMLNSSNDLPHDTKHSAISQIILMSSVRAEQNLSSPNQFSRSSTRSKRVKTRATSQWHVPYGT